MGGTVLSKTLLVSDAVARRSPVRPASGLVNQLRYPSEPPLPSTIGSHRDHDWLSRAAFSVAGWNIGWSGVYLALTLVFALLLKRPFGVTM